MLYVAGIVEESIVDGPGLRTTVFFQGCKHHCKGCHNPQTWSFEGGTPYTPEQLINELKKNKLVHHITLSGGDPLYQDRIDFLKFIVLLKQQGYDIILYTGFTLEEVQQMFSGEAIQEMGEQLPRLTSWSLETFPGLFADIRLQPESILENHRPSVIYFILNTVIFVTDPFVESLKSLEVRFRGSTNQRVVRAMNDGTKLQWCDISTTKEWSYSL